MKNKDKFISLKEAADCCYYSQEYLSLRARQGKLKSIKIGRNWVTKKEWIEEYLETCADGKIKPQKDAQIIQKEPPKNLPIETLTQKLNVSSVVVSRPIIRFRFAILFILILFLGGFFLLDQTKPTILPERTRNISRETIAILSEMSSRENQASTFQTFERYGQWLKESLESRVPASKSVYSAVDDFINEKLFRFGRFIVSPFSKVYRLVFSPEIGPKSEEKKAIEEPIAEEQAEPVANEGMVILPLQNGDQKIVEKIKESFSDEVKVEIEDETSGFIIPIFREKEGEKYLYIMVPVKN